jgi:hypothetical protein
LRSLSLHTLNVCFLNIFRIQIKVLYLRFLYPYGPTHKHRSKNVIFLSFLLSSVLPSIRNAFFFLSFHVSQFLLYLLLCSSVSILLVSSFSIPYYFITSYLKKKKETPWP